MTKFEMLIDEILEFMWQASPYSATFAGIHKYDHELDRVEQDFLEEINKKTKGYLKKISQIERGELTADEYIDWRMLKNALASNIKSFEEIRYWQKDPSSYVNICLYALHILLIRNFAPIEERAANILSRLKQIPRLLNDAKRNLKDSPPVFTKLGIEITEAGQVFFNTAIPQLAQIVPKLGNELGKAASEAGSAFGDYEHFLKNQHLPKSKGDFAIGQELFNFKLEKDHMLPYKAEEILNIGQEAKRATEAELEDIARTIDPTKKWWEVVADIKLHHPAPNELLHTYRQEMEAAKKFVMTKDLVAIPPDEELEVISTPIFDRPVLPYAAYMPPAPFDQAQKGYFYVTPVDETLPPEKQEEILRGHPEYGIPITALHEAYPGHHLQLVHANRVPRKLRCLLATSVFVEGWALYCEEMMYDEGFYSHPRTRLLKFKDQFWRACRVIIDVGLHTEKMSYEQAVDMLVGEAKLERVHAQKEVTRYTFTPTQPLSYMIGKKQLIELRDDYQKKAGNQFNLKQFHNQLLSFGSIPVVLIREAMGLTKPC